MKIAILTSPNQWFTKYLYLLTSQLGTAKIFLDVDTISENYDIVFILSYHKILSESFLSRNKHNIVVHGSPLPAGKGWSPVFWQVIDGKNSIPFTMIEADNSLDGAYLHATYFAFEWY